MFLLPSISPRVNQSPTAGFPYNRLDRLQGPSIIFQNMSVRSRRSYGDRRDRNRNRWHRTLAYISASFNIIAQIVYERDERVDIYVDKGN